MVWFSRPIRPRPRRWSVGWLMDVAVTGAFVGLRVTHPDDPRVAGFSGIPNLLTPSHSLSLPCAFHVWFTPVQAYGVRTRNRERTEPQLGLRCQRGLADLGG